MKNLLAAAAGRDVLKYASAAAAIAATSTAEYELARAIGMGGAIAAAVPIALDAYVLRALQKRREVLTSVLAMVGVNAASHLHTAGIIPLGWGLITGVSAIAPVVLWRVHALRTTGDWRERKLWGKTVAEHEAVTGVAEETPLPEHEAVTGVAEETPLPEHSPVDALPRREHWCGNTTPHAEHAHGPVTDPMQCYGTHDDGEHGNPWVPVSTPQERAQVASSTPSAELDVPDFLRQAREDTVRAIETVPVPAPLFPQTEHAREHRNGHAHEHGSAVRVPVPDESEHIAEHAPSTRVLAAVPALPDAFTPSTGAGTATGTAGHAALNAEHVAAGRLQPADTARMKEARALARQTIGGVPTVRALKAAIGAGTPVATRVRLALKYEHAGRA